MLTEIIDARHKGKASTGKEEGTFTRKAFLDAGASRGHRLIPLGKTVFETGKGHRVAVPFANEQRPDRWFLGISDEKYDVVVLLCRGADGGLFDFIIPRDFLEKFWGAFSRSGGQVKLNVSRSGNAWWLVIPGFDPQSIGSFLSNYRPLQN